MEDERELPSLTDLEDDTPPCGCEVHEWDLYNCEQCGECDFGDMKAEEDRIAAKEEEEEAEWERQRLHEEQQIRYHAPMVDKAMGYTSLPATEEELREYILLHTEPTYGTEEGRRLHSRAEGHKDPPLVGDELREAVLRVIDLDIENYEY